MILPLALAAVALLAPKRGAPPPPPPEPPDAPPSALAVSRVDVTFKRAEVLVVTDLSFAKDDRPRDWELFVAYGAPGVPRGFEAELLPLGEHELFAKPEAAGKLLPASHAPKAPPDAEAAVGARTSAGQVVTVPRDPGPGRVFVLRLRALHALPERAPDASVVVRVAHAEGLLPLGPLSTKREGKGLVEARVCGREEALALVVDGKLQKGVSPLVAARAATDDLCLRAAGR